MSDLIIPTATRTGAHSQTEVHTSRTVAGESGYPETCFTHPSRIMFIKDVMRLLAILTSESEESWAKGRQSHSTLEETC